MKTDSSARARFRFVTLLSLVLGVIVSEVCAQQQTQQSDIIARIFSGEFSAHLPAAPNWFDGGQSYIVIDRGDDGKGSNVVLYDTATGQKRETLITAAQLTPVGAKEPLNVEALIWSTDKNRALVFTNSRRVWRTNSRGDYWVLDRLANKLRRLGGNVAEASLMYAKFNNDASKVAYVRQNDLWVEDVGGGAIQRITKDGSALVINGGSDWVNEEELGLHDCFEWSPDGKQIAFWQFDLHGVGNFSLQYYLGQEKTIVTQIPYPDTGPYPVTMSVPYPLAGTTNSAVRAGIVSVRGGSVTWMKFEGDPRQHYIGRLQWIDGKSLLIQQLNRLQNTDQYLLIDANTGSSRRLWMDHDDEFIPIGFGGLPKAFSIRNGTEFLVMTERDGWMHVYRINRDGKETVVTRGAIDVVALSGVDERSNSVYFIASPLNATQRYLYRAPLDGSSEPVRITPATFVGTNNYSISPDGKYAFHAFSSFDDPGIRELVSLPDHQVIRTLGTSEQAKAKVKAVLDFPVEYFQVDAGDDMRVDGYMIKPDGFDTSKKYPVLVYVYGEPASQTVQDSWAGNTTLFHRYLASLGYLVVSFDNAGTPAPRGREWRKAVYGAVGVLSSKQQSTALRSLAQNRRYIDLDRVAVWGWSGGGTNTLNLIFRYPELYKVGMSVAPVPDQRLYDTIYQERYMGLPKDNAQGYKSASPINYAEGLKGNLLIIHGSGDDNVHYQGTELLVNRLVDLGKSFDFMTYPDRTHAISEGPGTTVHLYRLLTRYLTDHVPAGPK
jgi:dipeptidyl-peptidase-4